MIVKATSYVSSSYRIAVFFFSKKIKLLVTMKETTALCLQDLGKAVNDRTVWRTVIQRTADSPRVGNDLTALYTHSDYEYNF